MAVIPFLSSLFTLPLNICISCLFFLAIVYNCTCIVFVDWLRIEYIFQSLKDEPEYVEAEWWQDRAHCVYIKI